MKPLEHKESELMQIAKNAEAVGGETREAILGLVVLLVETRQAVRDLQEVVASQKIDK